MHASKEIVIIGGGIAGSFSAVFAAMFGHSVTVIDNPRPLTSSRIAAGLLNPVTGKTRNKSWMYDDCFEALVRLTGIPEFRSLNAYIHFMPVYRPASSIQVFNELSVKCATPAWLGLGHMRTTPLLPEYIHNPDGGFWATKAGWVDVYGLLTEIRKILTQAFSVRYIDSDVEARMINPESGHVNLHGETITFDELIFAEGVYGVMNDWFPNLPIIPLKGEILTVEIPGLGLDIALVDGCYVIPRGNDIYTVGSTYLLRFHNDLPSIEGRQEILASLGEVIRLPVTVLEHRAGVRPTTKNRRPLLGSHSLYPNLHIMNGLGTKGILRGPYFAYEMIRSLSHENSNTDRFVFVSGK